MTFARSSMPIALGLALLAAAVPASVQAAPTDPASPLVRIVGKDAKARAVPTTRTLRRYAGRSLTVECARPSPKAWGAGTTVTHRVVVRRGASVPVWEAYCVARVHLGGKAAKDPRQLFTPNYDADVWVARLRAASVLQETYRAVSRSRRFPTVAELVAGDPRGRYVAASSAEDTADFPKVAIWMDGDLQLRASTQVDGHSMFFDAQYAKNIVSSNALDLFAQLEGPLPLPPKLLQAWRPHPIPAPAAPH